GNLIPADQRDESIEAAIAFAVEKLRVSSIVVCGHSSCGAMNALLAGSAPASPGERHLQAWLEHGLPALSAYDDGGHPVAQEAAHAGFSAVDQLGMVNVATQVEALTRHPLVVEARKHGGLDVIGVFYDIPSAVPLRIGSTSIDSFGITMSTS
ncbi:carbonic anhydrase, partial [Mycobacteroides chelonae]|uniref:carbonic anhydrase n=1 Tax=Mycobacteroides chelonae TaxID=1774 RepID=UPI000B140355